MAGQCRMVLELSKMNRRPAQDHNGDATARTHHIDFEQACIVASAYLDAPRKSRSPVVRAAYADLSAQADGWFARLTGGGSESRSKSCTPGAPSHTQRGGSSPSVSRRTHARVWPASYDRERSHPLLDSSTGGTFDRFRAVHDIVSHAWFGYGFDRDGEFSASARRGQDVHRPGSVGSRTELHAEHSVRWTTRTLAEHKATLLAPRILRASQQRARRTSTSRMAQHLS